MNKSSVNKSPSSVNKKEYSLADIMNTLKIMRNDIQSINTKMLTQENTSTAILTRMDSLSAEIASLKKENEELKKDVDNLKKNSVDSNSLPNVANDICGLDLVKEIQEREIKSRNILLFNVDESIDDEAKLVADLIETLHIDVSISSVVRLGTRSNKPRPVRVIFNSPQSVFAVLKTKKVLSNIPRWKNVSVTTDLTFHQRSSLSALKKERDRRNGSDDGGWFIKYFRGSPRLVQKN
jgi:cell division protein FtsB